MLWNEEMIDRYRPSKTSHPNAFVRRLEEQRMRCIVGMLRAEPGDRILDAGCGDGELLDRIPAGQLHGVDLSPRLVRQAQSRLGMRAAVFEGDIERELPQFRRGAFDAICCSETLEHLQKPVAALRVLRTLLRPGGALVLSVPDERVINRIKRIIRIAGLRKLLLGDAVAERMEHAWHLQVLSRADCVRLLTSAGFRIEYCRSLPFRWLPIRRAFRAVRT
jgi:2-polyprenyl-3-methyl-5-hydroxy-6-metoxy-1,4-benzoquinol methylase